MHRIRQDRAQSIQSSDMHEVGVHHVCHDIECRVNHYGTLFRLTCDVSGHYQ